MLIYHGKFVIVNYTILPVVLSRGDSSGIRKICPRESSGWISWGNLDATIPSLPESSTKRKAVTWFVKGGLEACRRLYDIGTNRPLRTIRSPCTFDRKTFFPTPFLYIAREKITGACVNGFVGGSQLSQYGLYTSRQAISISSAILVAARYWGISPVILRTIIRHGEIPTRKLFIRLLF